MNRRRILAAIGDSGPTARDYVQDGLIAMWDGIENAGWGVHNPNATVWKDLIRNYDANYNENVVIENNCVYSENASPYATGAVSISGYRTIECVFSLPSDIALSKELFVFGSGGLNAGCMMVLSGGSLAGGDNRLSASCGPAKHGVVLLDDFTTYNGSVFCVSMMSKTSNVIDAQSGFVNSIEKQLITDVGNGYSTSSFVIGGQSPTSRVFNGGRIYSIRLYSRVINEEIVKKNYSVDKARFGLT